MKFESLCQAWERHKKISRVPCEPFSLSRGAVMCPSLNVELAIYRSSRVSVKYNWTMERTSRCPYFELHFDLPMQIIQERIGGHLALDWNDEESWMTLFFLLSFAPRCCTRPDQKQLVWYCKLCVSVAFLSQSTLHNYTLLMARKESFKKKKGEEKKAGCEAEWQLMAGNRNMKFSMRHQ